MKINNPQFTLHDGYLLNEEIMNFYKAFNILKRFEETINKIRETIRLCMSICLIKEGYEKSNQNRLKRFKEYFKNEQNKRTKEVFNENEYIYVKNIYISSCSRIELIYHIVKNYSCLRLVLII